MTNAAPRLPTFLPPAEGKSVLRAYAGGALLSWVAMPGRFREESEAAAR